MKNLNIGLFGFGNVGRGLYDVLQRIDSQNVHIKRVCVRDMEKERGVKAEFTANPDDIFNDKDIFSGKIVVEVFEDFYNAGRFCAAAIAGNRHKIKCNRNSQTFCKLTCEHNASL